MADKWRYTLGRNQQHRPFWKLKKINIGKMNSILHLALEQIAKISILLNPIIPSATTKVLDALNVKAKFRNLSFLGGNNVLADKIKVKQKIVLKF